VFDNYLFYILHTHNYIKIHYMSMTKRLRKMSLQWPHDIVRLINK
jgi:hypothetical protein